MVFLLAAWHGHKGQAYVGEEFRAARRGLHPAIEL